MLKQVVYTNSNCKDVWDMFVKENKKNSNLDLYVICDIEDFPIEDKRKIFTYSNNSDYYKVWIDALNYFNINNFIYLQEDFILYDKVNDNKLISLTETLNNSDFSFIRLIKSGSLNENKYDDNLYFIEPCIFDIFSMQPTIWKTSDYIKIMKSVKEKKWLETENYRNYMCNNNISGLYYYNEEPKRGGNHYDSSIYPYIATALVKGKWNLSEYKKELGTLLEQYNIDKDLRGVF
jgi:hypothetical protein